MITPDGDALSYASLAATAARTDPPTDVRLKPEAEWRYLGKAMQRIDIVGEIHGHGHLRHRHQDARHGLRHRAHQSDDLGGGIKGFDASAAEKSKGVIEIVPITGGVGVIADNTWRAFKAASLIKCDWGPAPYPATTAAMFETVAASFTADRQDSRFKDDGDVETALAGTGVLEAEYNVPYLAHAPLEPMNAVVRLKDGRLDIWTGTQIPLFVVAMAALTMTGLPSRAHPPACSVVRRQFRPAPGRRLCPPGHRAGEGIPGTPNQDDLDARRGHDPRLPASAGHGPHARRRQGWQGRRL